MEHTIRPGDWVEMEGVEGEVESFELRLMIWDAFNEHGIQIPYPQRDLHLHAESLPEEFQLQQAEH